jgi:hypothetical protein
MDEERLAHSEYGMMFLIVVVVVSFWMHFSGKVSELESRVAKIELSLKIR